MKALTHREPRPAGAPGDPRRRPAGRARSTRPALPPTASRLSQECHHMWARSFLRGEPYEWVSLPSGRIVSNRARALHAPSPRDHRRRRRARRDDPARAGRDVHLADRARAGLDQPGRALPAAVPRPGTVRRSSSHEHPPHAAHPNLAEGETCAHLRLHPAEEAGGAAEAADEGVDGARARTTRRSAATSSTSGSSSSRSCSGWKATVSLRLVRYHVLSSVLAWAMINRQTIHRGHRGGGGS